jgi:hypothetical protein
MKEKCQNDILRAIEKAREQGFNVFVASDPEGNSFNKIETTMPLFYGDTNDKSIVLGVFSYADESELFENIDIKSGWSDKDIEIFKKEIEKDREQAKGNYGFSDSEIEYIINY